MLINPFTPSEIVSSPEKFFGRSLEMQTISRAINQGSVAIQGGVGIGKSSLLSRILLHMNGFDSLENSEYILVVGNHEINTIDDVARIILEKLTDVDSKERKLKFNLKVFEYESSEAYSLFTEGRHLAALTRLLKDKSFEQIIKSTKYLLIAIDEVDKCAHPVARFIRGISTELQLQGLNNIRFILSGVSPYYEQMIEEDIGIARFIYKHINLGKMDEPDAETLLNTKFRQVAKDAEEAGIPVKIDPGIIDRILQLSGSHPHLLQLLGSHIIEHESENPDNLIDNRDLVGSLRSICYQSRGAVYQKLIRSLETVDKYFPFLSLIKLAKGDFPGKIPREVAEKEIEREDLDWFLNSNIIVLNSLNQYEIMDEFFRIRILIDEFEKEESLENQLLESGFWVSYDELPEFNELDDLDDES